MKKTLYILLSVILLLPLIYIVSQVIEKYNYVSAKSSVNRQEPIPPGFNFNQLKHNVLPEDHTSESYAAVFTNTFEIENGDTLMAKFFLANLHHVYNADILEPIITYQTKPDTSYFNLNENGTQVKVLNDTGYVKFVVRDRTIKKGESKIHTLGASLTIPLPKMDTIFGIRSQFRVFSK